VASLTALYSALTGDGSVKKKAILTALAVSSFVVGTIAAREAATNSETTRIRQENQNKLLQEKLDGTRLLLESAQKDLKDQSKLLDYVDKAVGQLSKLNDLAGGKSYYVRIAWGLTDAELTPYKSKLLRKFPGGKDSGLIVVRPTSPKGSELVFGTGLTLASAEIFKRMSDPYANPRGQADIRPED